MKCEYCEKELPKIINGRRDICSCDKADISWKLNMEMEHLKKRLSQIKKELSDLERK